MTGRLGKDIMECEMLLIGTGSEWKCENSDNVKRRIVTDIYNGLESFIGDKDYFIITSCDDGVIYDSEFDPKRISAPFFDGEAGEEQWEAYNGWLQTTLNHKLLLLELGEGFDNPGFMRWPFENITFVNMKAMFYRIHAKLPNVPGDIGSRSAAVRENSVEFIVKMLENVDKTLIL